MKHKSIIIGLTAAAVVVFLCDATSAASPAVDDQVIPVIEMENVLLTDAIRQLARQARLNVVLDPKLSASPFDRVTVSFRWQDVTAREALDALLDNHGLVLVESPHPSARRSNLKF